MRDLIYMANSGVGQGRRDRDPDLIWSRFVDTRQIFFVCAKKQEHVRLTSAAFCLLSPLVQLETHAVRGNFNRYVSGERFQIG